MTTAKEAHDRADAAHTKIDSHEEICAIRYANLNTSIDDVKRYIVWLSGLLLSLLLGTLVWALQAKSNSYDQRDADLLKEIREMRRPGA